MRQAGASPARQRSQDVAQTAVHLDRLNDVMRNVRNNMTTLALNLPEPVPSTSDQAPIEPVISPIGNRLKNLPKKLYAHIPSANREKIGHCAYTDFRTVLLDPLVP